VSGQHENQQHQDRESTPVKKQQTDLNADWAVIGRLRTVSKKWQMPDQAIEKQCAAQYESQDIGDHTNLFFHVLKRGG